MDALELGLQRRPLLSTVTRRLRVAMRWVVRRFLPGALKRPELAQARAVMADAPQQPISGPRVLFMTFRAFTTPVAWDTTIAQALRLRGARCEFFYCGGGLPICEIGWPREEAERPCQSCGPYVAGMLEAAGFPRRSLSDFISGDERRAIELEVRRPAHDGTHVVDPIIQQSLMQFFRTGTLPETEECGRARDDFRVGAAIMKVVAPRLLGEISPDVVVLLNGLLFEDRIVREEALARGVRCVSYEAGAQAGTLFLSETRPAGEYDITELWEESGTESLDEASEHSLATVLSTRRTGAGMPLRYYARRRTLDKTEYSKLVAVFTNVSWDLAVTGEMVAFDSMTDWVSETVRIAECHPDMEFVIRAHPAETRFRGLESRERLPDFARGDTGSLPANARLVPAEEALDSYALIDSADIVAVFSSTVGLEAAAVGKPVCVAGKTHYRGRGFTTDVMGTDDYRALFDNLAWTDYDAERHASARRYAYLFCTARERWRLPRSKRRVRRRCRHLPPALQAGGLGRASKCHECP